MGYFKTVRPLLAGIALGALAVSSASFAQADSDTAETAQNSTNDYDIIVTARLREETLQSVPVAVTALSGDMLAERGFSSIKDMEQVTPGLKFSSGGGGNSGGFNAFIRGVGESDFIVTSDPAVALYIDGIYVARSFGADLGLNDIDRVEVLRGPQGSLFGKNTIGGAVNVVTRNPDGVSSLDADVRVGSFKSARFRGTAGFTLGEDLFGSVSAIYRRANGWQDVPGNNNDLGNENALSGRLKLRWNPDGGPDVILSVDGRRQRQNGRPHNTIANDLTAPFPGFSAAFFEPCCEITDDPDKFAAESPYNFDDADAFNVSLTASIPVGTGSIKSITAYRHVDALFGRGINSINPTYVGDFHDERSRQFSQELQYENSFLDDRVSVLAGLYFFRERSLDHTTLHVVPGLTLHPGFPGFLGFIGFPAAAAPLFDVNLDFDNRQTTKNYAVFGNATVKLTEQISLDLGGRFTHEKKRFFQKGLRTDQNVPLIPQAPEYTLNDSWDSFTPKATLSFQATPDVLLYATYSKGFRSGGFNGRPTQFEEIGGYEPEKLTSWEAGLKSSLLDGKLRFNLAAYTNKYKNQQVQVNTIAGDGITIIAVVQNSGKSHMRGFEAETSLRLGSIVTIDGSVAYLDSGYDEYLSNGVDLSHLNLTNAPEWTANLGLNLNGEIGSGMQGRLRLDSAYKAAVDFDSRNAGILRTDAYWTFNANAGIDWDSGWMVQATAENFTDRREIVGGFDVRAAFGIAEAYYTPPARYFLTVGYRY
ncbi:MAG: TonB-dependent receptor [Sphingomonadaceae bacterium]|nr:TonB-dependent receptor [Sphingomonadaceae bacterium]